MNCSIKALPVRCGDCLLIRYDDHHTTNPHYILVDTGYANTYHRTLKPIIRNIKSRGQQVDLFILTHTDGDHIGGAKPLLRDFGADWYKQAWFNYAPVPYCIDDYSGEISIKKSIPLRDKLLENSTVNATPILTGYEQIIGNALLTVLSPDKAQFDLFLEEWRKEEPESSNEVSISAKESDHSRAVTDLINNHYEPDTSWSNRSSIAFILQIGATKALFTGDGHAELLVTSLRAKGYSPVDPVKLELMKIAHHGSKGNISDELMSYIDCQRYLISTNSGNKHGLPDKEALARIVWSAHTRHPDEPIHLYFTYNDSILRDIFSPEERQRFNLVCHHPDNETGGITVTYPTNESLIT